LGATAVIVAFANKKQDMTPELTLPLQ